MKKILAGLGLILIAALIAAFVYRDTISRFYQLAHIFDEESIVYNFQNMDEIFPTSPVEGGGKVVEFERGTFELPANFTFKGKTFDTEQYLADAATTGLLVLHKDKIVYEEYWLGHTAEKTHIAWSVSKSYLSALFGIAVDDGDIKDIMQPVTDYVPELVGSGYDGVPIKHVLQMSSGVGFNEDYSDPNSDINRMGESMAMGDSLLEFSATLKRARPPGTLQHYVSIDTQVLGTVLVRATGKDLSSYTSEKLWKPLGMESDAFWMVDGSGMGMAFGGLNASLRDFMRMGRLYLNKGNWFGEQIVSESWVHDSITPDAPHLMPGKKPGSENPLGYGYQWWIPEDWIGNYMALGVYDQMIYVDPNSDLVIARHAANLDFQRNNFEPTDEAVALFRAIAADLAKAEVASATP